MGPPDLWEQFRTNHVTYDTRTNSYPDRNYYHGVGFLADLVGIVLPAVAAAIWPDCEVHCGSDLRANPDLPAFAFS